MRIHLYEKSGFCSGVNRAVKLALELAQKESDVYTLGPLVHNREVKDYLYSQGVKSVSTLDELKGGHLVIRSHGVGPETFHELSSRREISVYDGTCPRVKKIQSLVKDLVSKGVIVFIWGDSSHPEVQGIFQWSGGEALVVSDLEELPGELARAASSEKTALVSQTTREVKGFNEAAHLFKQYFPEGEVYDTICTEVKSLQDEAVKLAACVEAMVVVGSSFSSNTEKLARLCSSWVPTFRVSHAGEIKPEMFKGIKEVGVIAGASTPEWIIKEVVEMMEDAKMEEEFNEGQEEAQKEQQENEVTSSEAMNQEDLEYQEVKTFEVGERARGKVAQIEDEHILVDIGYKTEAVLSRSEVYLEEDATLQDKFSLEMDIEVVVLRVNEEEGSINVSHRRVEKEKQWSTLENALENDEPLEGKVKEVVDAGVIVDLGAGIEGFMPGSLVDTGYIPDFSQFLGETLTFKVIEMNRDRNKVILSRKKVMEEEEESKKQEAVQNLEEGSLVKGVVRRLTDFGAFVDVGGIDGLVHISEVSWERVEHPRDVLTVGEEVEVKVLEVIPERERVSLSIRKAQPDPWTDVSRKFNPGDIVEGKVTRLVNFGVFVELMPGVEGLVHISQVADHHVKHPSEVVKEGEKIKVKVLDLRPEEKRISLSIKEAFTSSIADYKEKESDPEGGSGVKLGDVFGDLFNETYSGEEEEKEE